MFLLPQGRNNLGLFAYIVNKQNDFSCEGCFSLCGVMLVLTCSTQALMKLIKLHTEFWNALKEKNKEFNVVKCLSEVLFILFM